MVYRSHSKDLSRRSTRQAKTFDRILAKIWRKTPCVYDISNQEKHPQEATEYRVTNIQYIFGKKVEKSRMLFEQNYCNK